MSKAEKADSVNSFYQEEGSRFCVQATCLGFKDQDWKITQQEIKVASEEPPPDADKWRFQQVIRELNDKFEELQSAFSESSLLRHCSSHHHDQNVIARKKGSLPWSDKCRPCLSERVDELPHLQEHQVKECENAPECTGGTSTSPSGSVRSAGLSCLENSYRPRIRENFNIEHNKQMEVGKSGNLRTEECQERVESEIEEPQGTTILETQSQVPAINQGGDSSSSWLTVEKVSDKDSYTDTASYAKETEGVDLSESYQSSQSIPDDEDSMSLPTVDEISNQADLEFPSLQVSDVDQDQDRENSEQATPASSELHQYQINSENDSSENINPEPLSKRTQKEATEFSETWEANSKSDKADDYHWTGSSDHNQDTKDTELDILESHTSQMTSSQLQKGTKKLLERRADIKESSEKQDVFFGTKLPRTKSNTTKLVAFFSGMNNQPSPLTGSDQERPILSGHVPSLDKTSPSKLCCQSTERHSTSPFISKHRKTGVSREALPVAKAKEVTSKRNFRSNLVQPKPQDVKKTPQPREIKSAKGKGQNSAGQDDTVVQTDALTKSEETSAAENAQSVDAILMVLESMQRTLAKISSSQNPSIKPQFGRDVSPRRLEQKQALSMSAPRTKKETTCSSQEDKEEGEESENSRKSLLAYNIANQIVGQAVKKVMELYPEFFVKQYEKRFSNAEPNFTDPSSMTLALAALKEVLRDLNANSKEDISEEGPKSVTSTAVGTSPTLFDSTAHTIASEIVHDLVTSAVSRDHLSDKTVQTEGRSEDSFPPSDAGRTAVAYLPEEHARRLSFQFVTNAVKKIVSLLSDATNSTTSIGCSPNNSSINFPDSKALVMQGDSVKPSAGSTIFESAAFSNIMHDLANNVYNIVQNVVSQRQSSEAREGIETDDSKAVQVLLGFDAADPDSVRDKNIVFCQDNNQSFEKNITFDYNSPMLYVNKEEIYGSDKIPVECFQERNTWNTLTNPPSNSLCTEPYSDPSFNNKEKIPGSDKVTVAAPEEFFQESNIEGTLTKWSTSNGPFTEPYSDPSFKREQEVALQASCPTPGAEEKLLPCTVEYANHTNKLFSSTALQSQTAGSSELDSDSSIERLMSAFIPPNIPPVLAPDSRLQDASSDTASDDAVSFLLQMQIERERMNREVQGTLNDYLRGDTSSSLYGIDRPFAEMGPGRPAFMPYAGAFRPCNRIRGPRSQREDSLPGGLKREQSASRSLTSLRHESHDVRAACFTQPRQGHDPTCGINAGKDFSFFSEPRLSPVCRKPDHSLPGGRDAVVQTEYDWAGSRIPSAAVEAVSPKPSDGQFCPWHCSRTENNLGSSAFPSPLTTGQINRHLKPSSVQSWHGQAQQNHMVNHPKQADISEDQTLQFICQVLSLQKAKEAVDEQLQDLCFKCVEMIRDHPAPKDDGSCRPGFAPPLSSPLQSHLSTCLPGARNLAENEMERNAGGFEGFVTRKLPGEIEKDGVSPEKADGSHQPSQYVCISVPPWNHEKPLDADEETFGNIDNSSSGPYGSKTARMESTIKEDLKQLPSAVNTLSGLVYKQCGQIDNSNRHLQHQTTLRPTASTQRKRKVLLCFQPHLSSPDDGGNSTGSYDLDWFQDQLSCSPSQPQEINPLKSESTQTPFFQDVQREIFPTDNYSELRHGARAPDATTGRTFHTSPHYTLSGFSKSLSDASGHLLGSSFVCRQPTQPNVNCRYDHPECLNQSKVSSSVPSNRSNWTSRASCHTGLPLKWNPAAAVDILHNGGNVYSYVGVGDNPEQADQMGKISSCNPSPPKEDLCHNSLFTNKSSNPQSGDSNPDTNWFSRTSVNCGATEEGVASQARGSEEHVLNHLPWQLTGMKSSEQKFDSASNAPPSEDAGKQGHTFRSRSLPSSPRSHRAPKGLSLVPLLMAEADVGIVHAYDPSVSTFTTDNFRGKAFQTAASAAQENHRIQRTHFRPEPSGAIGVLTEVDSAPSSVDAEMMNATRFVSFIREDLEADLQEFQPDTVVDYTTNANATTDSSSPEHVGCLNFSALRSTEVYVKNPLHSVQLPLLHDFHLKATDNKERFGSRNQPTSSSYKSSAIGISASRINVSAWNSGEFCTDSGNVLGDTCIQKAIGSDCYFASSSGAAVASEQTPDTDKLGMNMAGSFINMDDAQTGVRNFLKSGMSSKLWNCSSSSSGHRKVYDREAQWNTRDTGTTKKRCQEATSGAMNPHLKSFRQIHSLPGHNIQSTAEDQISHNLFSSPQAASVSANTVSSKPTSYHQSEVELRDGDFKPSFNQRRLKTDTDAKSGNSTAFNSTFHISTPSSSDLAAGELHIGNHVIKMDFNTRFSDEEINGCKMKPLNSCFQGSTTKTQRPSIRLKKVCQNNGLNAFDGSLFGRNKRPGIMDSILDDVEQTPPKVPHMQDSISSTWKQLENHNKMGWRKAPKLTLSQPLEKIKKKLQQCCAEQAMQDRLGKLSYKSDGQEFPLVSSIIQKHNLSAILDVKNRKEITAPQLACGGYQLLQLVQHQISGSKETMEMGKKMSSSHGRINCYTNSGYLGNLFSSQENAVSTPCSSSTVPGIINSKSYPTVLASESNYSLSSVSESGSSTTLSFQDDSDTKSRKLP